MDHVEQLFDAQRLQRRVAGEGASYIVERRRPPTSHPGPEPYDTTEAPLNSMPQPIRKPPDITPIPPAGVLPGGPLGNAGLKQRVLAVRDRATGPRGLIVRLGGHNMRHDDEKLLDLTLQPLRLRGKFGGRS